MVMSRNLFPPSFLSLLMLLAGLTMSTDSQAKDKPKPKPQPAKKAPAKAALGEETKLEEAELLRKALILLAEGNHEYDGHRVKAMGAVQAAVKILDDSVLKNGSPKLKSATKKSQAIVAKMEEAGKNAAVVHERQPQSDAQLRKAAEALAEVRPTLATHKQLKVLEHLDHAVKELSIALEIR